MTKLSPYAGKEAVSSVAGSLGEWPGTRGEREEEGGAVSSQVGTGCKARITAFPKGP